jgi:hypothetical protein
MWCLSVQVEKELSEICSSILQLLDDHLIPTASSGESKVFYLKMKGDYHRYLAEFKSGTDRKDAAEHTLLAYKAAQVPHSSLVRPKIVAFVNPLFLGIWQSVRCLCHALAPAA